MDSEIRITPRVDLTELTKLSTAMERVKAQFEAVQAAAKSIKLPTAGAKSGAAAGALFTVPLEDLRTAQRLVAEMTASGTKLLQVPVAELQTAKRLIEDMAATAQSIRLALNPAAVASTAMGMGAPSAPGAPGGPGGSAPVYRVGGRPRGSRSRTAAPPISPGQFLTQFEDIIQPILPELDQIMMTQGAPGIAPHVRTHLEHLAKLAPHVGSKTSAAAGEASMAATLATGVDPRTLWEQATAYRAYQQRTGNAPGAEAVAQAYLGAYQRAQKAQAGSGARGLPGWLHDVAGAVGAGGVTGAVGKYGAAGLGLAGGLWLGGQVVKGWQQYREQGTAFSAISRNVGTLGDAFNHLRIVVDRTGTQFAESLSTITQVTQALVPSVGQISTGALRRTLTATQGLAYAYGMNPVTMAQAMGTAAQAGIIAPHGARGQMNAAQFAGLVANAVAAGNMEGRQGQVLTSLLGISQQIAARLARTPNEALLANMLTVLNRTGNPLLQGNAGAAVLSQINSGIQSPGLGAAGQLAMYQSLNRGGQLKYWQEQWLQGQGIAGTNPYTGLNNLTAVTQYWQRLLPKTLGTRIHGHWMPSSQTAFAASMMGQQLGISPYQALDVLQAFQGQSLSAQNRTTQLATQWGGAGGLQTLLSHGALPLFSQIVQAQHVRGPGGLQALAHQVRTLHGTVPTAFTHVLQQYLALGRQHARSPHQHAEIAHQRALDLAHMRSLLGHGLLQGPRLATGMDRYNTTIAKTTQAQSELGRAAQGAAQALAHLQEGILRPTHPLAPRIMSRDGFHAGKTGYSLPSGGGGWGAQLAGFVQGNLAQSLLQNLGQMLGGGGPASGGANQLVAWGGGGATNAQQSAWLQKMLPYAQSVSRRTHLPPALLLAQWAKESQWGTSEAAQLNHNLGGIKPWAGAGAGADRTYAGYGSLGAFAQGDAAFYLDNPRYRPLLQAASQGASMQTLVQLLQQSGYSSNSQYGAQLMQLLSQIESHLSTLAGGVITNGLLSAT